MDLSKYQCPNCARSELQNEVACWRCLYCGREYACINRIPRLYLENVLAQKDKELRDTFYDGFLGKYYQYVMPFLLLPARPARMYWKGWLVYLLVVSYLLGVGGSLLSLVVVQGIGTVAQLFILLLLAAMGFFFIRHRYLFYLLVLAVPVKSSLVCKRFRPAKSFSEVHAAVLQELSSRGVRLQLLDISTGTCNSLYQHGWMNLDAEYTGLDLSETMLLQGQKLMAKRHIPIEFVLGVATRLPFANETFDIVLNYGALNGFADPKLALEEMARVGKKGALILFLDEQLYESATFVERIYFKTVLSSHNVIHRCPLELIPDTLRDISVYQVYPFYYLCTCYKS